MRKIVLAALAVTLLLSGCSQAPVSTDKSPPPVVYDER